MKNAMPKEEQKIKCPECSASISIDDVLTSQISETIREEMEAKQKSQEAELARKTEVLEKEMLKLAEAQKNSEAEIAKEVAEKMEIEKIALLKSAKEEAGKESEAEKQMLEAELAAKSEKLREANEKELMLRKERNKLEEERQGFELEKQRQLDEARKQISEEASEKATEESRFVIAQLQKRLSDATKAKDDLSRKLEQGSQQTQGEVLELELEEVLRAEFPHDQILPVPKGVNGADIIQKVCDHSGSICGQIVWESKKTKAWSEGWIQKLKDDQRLIKADIAVIVSSVLPEGVKGIALRDGVWVCDIKFATSIAAALRHSLEAVSRERAMSVGKNDKMEILYTYLTGTEFKQRIEAIVEAFSAMDDSLKKERIAYERIWSEREKQIQRVIKNTVGIYGDLSGVVQLQKIDSLELPEPPADTKASLFA
jgi:hypothetical protein